MQWRFLVTKTADYGCLSAAMNIGIIIFKDVTQLDFTGPYEVFSRLPGVKIHLIAESLEPIACDHGMRFLPDTTRENCPPLDLLCVPGGSGVNDVVQDSSWLDFIAERGRAARFVTSVCTGSLVLAAAGLLKGKRATCHWMSKDFLKIFGAIPQKERVVMDGNTITGGGVTAGIDFALRVAAEVAGEDTAKSIQLSIEYNPAPPFEAGHSDQAGPELRGKLLQEAKDYLDWRGKMLAKVAEKRGLHG